MWPTRWRWPRRLDAYGWRRCPAPYGWFYYPTCHEPDWWGWWCHHCGWYVSEYGLCHEPDWSGWWCPICNTQEDGSVFGLQVCPHRGRLYFDNHCAECHRRLPRVLGHRMRDTYHYRICPICYAIIVRLLERRLRVLTNHGTTDIIMGFLTSLR